MAHRPKCAMPDQENRTCSIMYRWQQQSQGSKNGPKISIFAKKRIWGASPKQTTNDPDVTWTRNLLIASLSNTGVKCSTVEPPGLGLDKLNPEMPHSGMFFVFDRKCLEHCSSRWTSSTFFLLAQRTAVSSHSSWTSCSTVVLLPNLRLCVNKMHGVIFLWNALHVRSELWLYALTELLFALLAPRTLVSKVVSLSNVCFEQEQTLPTQGYVCVDMLGLLLDTRWQVAWSINVDVNIAVAKWADPYEMHVLPRCKR